MIVIHLGTSERRKADLAPGEFFFELPDGSMFNWASMRLWAGDEFFETPDEASDWALFSATRDELTELVAEGYGGLIRRSSSLDIVEE